MALATGASNEVICEKLHLSLDTVRSHIKSLYRKTGAAGRADLVNRAKKADFGRFKRL